MENLKEELKLLSTKEIKNILNNFNISFSNQSKSQLIDMVCDRYYDMKKYISYTYVRQLGHEGKDGRTFLARTEDGKECAVKIFKKDKGSKSIKREASLQMIAADYGISPHVIDYDAHGKYIVMEKLDTNLYDLFCEQKGQLTIPQQKAIIKLFKKLDKCGVFHMDPNPLNFMSKNGKWYVIDFGFSKLISEETDQRYGKNPNIKYMPLGFLLKLREIYQGSTLKYIEKYCK